MNSFLKTTIIVISSFFFLNEARAQSPVIEIMGHSVINGATAGATLSTGIWMINDDGTSFDIDEFSFGLGAGMLGGIGVGLYDAFSSEGNTEYALKGIFNLSRNRSGLILLDTFYGAGAGLVVSGALALMTEDRSWNTIKQGVGVGSWFGFGFGLVDAFLFAKQTSVAPSVGFGKYPNSTKRYEWALAKSHSTFLEGLGNVQYLSPVSLRIDFGR